MDVEEEVPDTMIKKKSSKKQKRGLIVRGQINTAAAELNGIADQPTGNPEVQKQKAGPETDEPDAT
jgi:hypothetical protein